MNPLVSIKNVSVLFNQRFQLNVDQLCINSQQHTVICGPNGSGKSALAAFIAGQGEILHGQVNINVPVAWVSVEQQQALIEAEKQKDCADILDIIPEPTLAKEVLLAEVDQGLHDKIWIDHVIQAFSLQVLLDRPFRALSTGETRKLLLANAILKQPALLILDEPWDGLDAHACEGLSQLLLKLSSQVTLMFVVNRLTEVPDYCQQILLIQEANLTSVLDASENLQVTLAQVKQWQNIQQPHLTLPEESLELKALPPLDPNAPLVKLQQVQVKYGEHIVFQNIDWSIWPNEHWQLTGPNGSGKTCLLNLITGDHPQCYVNDIYVFGHQRGSGESIWQIKQYIGFMSNGFHLDYRVNCSALHVVLSGFYDSIGLYQNATRQQHILAKKWLALLGLDNQFTTPFQQLSFGDQRLLLIARAMVKHPPLLILDEPCNGLDDINRLKVLALIDLLARAGSTTLLYVNHHAEDCIPSIKNHMSMSRSGA